MILYNVRHYKYNYNYSIVYSQFRGQKRRNVHLCSRSKVPEPETNVHQSSRSKFTKLGAFTSFHGRSSHNFEHSPVFTVEVPHTRNSHQCSRSKFPTLETFASFHGRSSRPLEISPPFPTKVPDTWRFRRLSRPRFPTLGAFADFRPGPGERWPASEASFHGEPLV